MTLSKYSSPRGAFLLFASCFAGRFVDTAKVILQKLRPGCAAVFYQTDSILVADSGCATQYVDKSFLCSLAAHQVGSPMLWHKIALRNPVSIGSRG